MGHWGCRSVGKVWKVYRGRWDEDWDFEGWWWWQRMHTFGHGRMDIWCTEHCQNQATRPSQFPLVLISSLSTLGSPTPSSPPTPSKLVHLPFFEWENMTMLSITSLNTVLAARLLHISMPISFVSYHPLQPHHFHNELTTSLFDNGECNGEVYFAGLAPHRCQTAVIIVRPPFWCTTHRLSPQIHMECHLSTERASMLPMTPCMAASLAPMPCMHSTMTDFFFGLLIQSNNWIYRIHYTLY